MLSRKDMQECNITCSFCFLKKKMKKYTKMPVDYNSSKQTSLVFIPKDLDLLIITLQDLSQPSFGAYG